MINYPFLQPFFDLGCLTNKDGNMIDKMLLKIKYIMVYSIIVLASCDDSINTCNFGEIKFEAINWEGKLKRVDSRFAITYHVPGTIDSFMTGIICDDSMIPEELKIEGSYVIFSGNYRDDLGVIDPLIKIGGEKFYFLELTVLTEDQQNK